MSSHPLQFFKDLIETPITILQMERKFYEEEEDFSIVLERNKEEGYLIMDNPLDDSSTYKLYFKNQIKRICYEEERKFIDDLDAYVFHEKEPKLSYDYLQKALFEINHLILIYNEKKWLEKHPVILEVIMSIRNHLHLKYSLADEVSTSAASVKKINNPKIQWLGKTNVLTTLFYDLLNGQDKGEPYIHANKKDVMQFLIDNFLDRNGDELSESTVQSYFDKQDKKAKIGDRIELPNKKIIR